MNMSILKRNHARPQRLKAGQLYIIPLMSLNVTSGESKAELTGAQLRHFVAELRHL